MMKRSSPEPHSLEPLQKRPLVTNEDGTPRFRGCSSIKRYEIMDKLGEGTFGEVHKARDRENGAMVALKKILMQHEKEGFPITALREIKIMKILSHKNVLTLKEMAVEREKDPYKPNKVKLIIYMVTPYMDHDLSGLLENPNVKFTEPQIKCYMLQLLEGTKYLHENHILHRDMKAANLLIDNRGILQIADFGLARKYDEPPPVPGGGGGVANRDYTQCVVTRWYRPPELLLGERKYTTAIDLWGVGCVFAEMYKGKPILPGQSDLDQAHRIFKLCGSPNERNMPGWGSLPGCDGVRNFGPYPRSMEHQFSDMGSAGVSLLTELLTLDPRKRINAIDGLKHEYFTALPLPAKPSEIPKFEESHELDRRRRHQRIPPAPAGGTVGVGSRAQNQQLPWDSREDSRRGNGGWDSRGGGGGGGRPYDSRGGAGQQPVGQPRIPPGVHTNTDHRPPWAAKSLEPQSLPMGRVPPRDHGLPPRPPMARDDRDRLDRGGGPMERSRSGRNGASNIDTYIPSYPRGDDGLPRGRDDSRGWDRDRDRDYHRDRDRDRDWDRRERPPRDDREYVRKRSRSPPHPPLDRDRDRDSRRAYGDRR